MKSEEMKDFGIVIPNRYPDIIAPLIESISRLIPAPLPRIVIVADGHINTYGFEMISCWQEKFVFAKAANIGILAAGSDSDILLLNDDMVILEPNFFIRLWLEAKFRPKVGILSPLIKGCAGNEIQRWHDKDRYWKPGESVKCVLGSMPICFPCVYLRRKMLDEIGLLDERFIGYGGEDADLCLRARRAGWMTAVISSLVIQHGDGGAELGPGRGKTWSLSFSRRYPHG